LKIVSNILDDNIFYIDEKIEGKYLIELDKEIQKQDTDASANE